MLPNTASRALLSSVLLCPALLTPTVASAAAETCQGMPATIVGTPDAKLSGTESGDVIVTAGAATVLARGGDDLICVTGGGTILDAGDGDDVVDATAARGRVSAELGHGADRYLGSAGVDSVSAGGSRGDHDTDVVDT